MKLQKTRLDQCCQIISGSTPKTSVKEYWGGDIYWATPKDLSNLKSSYIDETPRTITKKGLSSCGAEVLPVNSVLFSSRAPIGHVAINRVPMATNQGFKSFIPDRERLDATFLYYWLSNNRDYLNTLGNGATFKELSKAIISRVEIPLPPIDQQKRIAAILDKAEELRRLRRQSIEQLDILGRSIFIEMFGDPMTNPNGWKSVSFEDVLSIPLRNGLSPSHSGKVIGQLLTLSAITGKEFKDTAVKTSTFKSIAPFHQTVSDTDFLICRGNGNIHLVGKGYFPKESMPNTAFPDTIIAAKVKPEIINKFFLQHIWNSDFIRSQIESLARTTNGTFKVNQTMLESILLLIPPLPLQQKFTQRIEVIEQLKLKHQESLAQIDALLASLQDRAFTGEL
jgi:type I restriction enzyme, S subunit